MYDNQFKNYLDTITSVFENVSIQGNYKIDPYFYFYISTHPYYLALCRLQSIKKSEESAKLYAEDALSLFDDYEFNELSKESETIPNLDIPNVDYSNWHSSTEIYPFDYVSSFETYNPFDDNNFMDLVKESLNDISSSPVIKTSNKNTSIFINENGKKMVQYVRKSGIITYCNARDAPEIENNNKQYFLSMISSRAILTQSRLPSIIKRTLLTKNAQEGLEISGKVNAVLIPGDGIGPSLAESVKEVIQRKNIPLHFEEIHISGADYDPTKTVEYVEKILRQNNNVGLKGTVLEPVDDLTFNELQGLNLKMKKGLDLFANVAFIKTMDGIKTRHGKELDFVIIREQTEGEYSAIEHESVPGVVECLKISTRPKIERIAKFAFDFAVKHNRKKVTCVHKANIMKLGDGLFLKICQEVSRKYPGIEFEGMIVDNTCMQLVSKPEQFDVMVMPNLYGNIIDNLAAGLVGGAGVVPSYSIGSEFVVFEPGSRHTYAKGVGKNVANPTAMLLATSKLLNHLHLKVYGNALKDGVEKTIRSGNVTKDLGGNATTLEFTEAVIKNINL
ncbi:Isocitrate dehydrogenase [NAD] subunit gamma, mitochondrial [Strongyloides ratti]|uniref:Isocitrate dehydrogenase [NAD] subunit, mitochondrial n=1 Tax=Strongyloides ratti TaxID=34506 RepID=A0A090MZX4_STRRB|nr:Isocitrate dehydrogenase [NAD] subunit gamma, mitochondrial [Strongyloides ratti]CEF69690.1 Isocitrate dehydrogenase [NAD] subunit gamma, mitochondrial [Strongyloides ratti]